MQDNSPLAATFLRGSGYPVTSNGGMKLNPSSNGRCRALGLPWRGGSAPSTTTRPLRSVDDTPDVDEVHLPAVGVGAVDADGFAVAGDARVGVASPFLPVGRLGFEVTERDAAIGGDVV